MQHMFVQVLARHGRVITWRDETHLSSLTAALTHFALPLFLTEGTPRRRGVPQSAYTFVERKLKFRPESRALLIPMPEIMAICHSKSKRSYIRCTLMNT